MKPQKLSEILTGPRITLKKHSLELASIMFEYVDQDRERLREFLPWVDLTKTLEDEISYIKFTHKSWDEMSVFDYGIFRNDDGAYMGNVGPHTISWPDNCAEFGYWILGDFEGQGFMSEAITVLEEHMFEIGFNRLEIRCSSLNKRSSGIPKRLGYHLDGVLRQDAIKNGKYRDTLVYSKLKSEHKTD